MFTIDLRLKMVMLPIKIEFFNRMLINKHIKLVDHVIPNMVHQKIEILQIHSSIKINPNQL